MEETNRQLTVAKEEKEKILNTVAHDLRSPVNNISGLSNMLLMDEQLTVEQKGMIELILQASDNSLSLINELLQSNKKGGSPGTFREADLNDVVDKAVSLLKVASSEKNIRIEVSLAKNDMTVSIDKHRIERVISNLVNNAIKFSANGSVITIQTVCENDQAVLLIRDEGIGIPQDRQSTIFYTSPDASRAGTAGETGYGMGLSICKQIIEEHKGSITLESEVGKGTSVFVRLPFLNRKNIF